jgi:hypothetical protein
MGAGFAFLGFGEAAAEATALEAAGAESEVAAARGGVYTLRDAEGAVVRTGRTNDLERRAAEHANDPVTQDLDFQTEYRTDDYAEQRGLEQDLYDRYPEAQVQNGGLNKIRPISPSNPNLSDYMQAAADYLSRIGGGG